VKRALLYLGLLGVLTAIFLLHNHNIHSYQPTSRGIGLIIIGAAIAISSTALQGYYQNKIADPGLMGLMAGASLGSVIGIELGFKFGSRLNILVAILFTFITFYIFDYLKNKFFINGLLLSLILSTPTILISRKGFHDYLFWTLGSFKELNKINVRIFAPFVEVGIITTFFVARKLSSGKNVKIWLALGLAFLLGPFVSVAGSIYGLGIFIPKLTRKLIKGDTRRVLSYAALVGPIILLLLDIAINHAKEVSVSVVTLAFALALSWFSKEQAQSE
jgi:iron complex transport system permease protein